MSAGIPKTAIFFDNNIEHVETVRADGPNIECVLIDETHAVPDVNMTTLVHALPDMVGNPYYEFIRVIQHGRDAYDAVSGIQEGTLRTYFGGLFGGAVAAAGAGHRGTSAPARKRAVHNIEYGGSGTSISSNVVQAARQYETIILDWDRTLTMFEGVLIYNTTFANDGYLRGIHALLRSKGHPGIPGHMAPVSREDMLVYLFGGRARLEMLRNWLFRMIDEGKRIVIVTNNTTAGHAFPFRNGFIELVRGFLPGVTTEYRSVNPADPDIELRAPMPLTDTLTILCSADYGANKAVTLEANITGFCVGAMARAAAGAAVAGGGAAAVPVAGGGAAAVPVAGPVAGPAAGPVAGAYSNARKRKRKTRRFARKARNARMTRYKARK